MCVGGGGEGGRGLWRGRRGEEREVGGEGGEGGGEWGSGETKKDGRRNGCDCHRPQTFSNCYLSKRANHISKTYRFYKLNIIVSNIFFLI